MFRLSRKAEPSLNLLDLRPKRNLDFEINDDRQVTLKVPKFQNKFAVKWIVPHIRKKFFRVRLDQYGSFVWTRCDGATSVAEISEQLKRQFGETVDPTYGRIQRFIQMFLRDKFLSLPEQ